MLFYNFITTILYGYLSLFLSLTHIFIIIKKIQTYDFFKIVSLLFSLEL